MRRGVDFIGVNCAFLCHDGHGRVLLQRRGANCRDEQGRWDSGAGSMEFGESFEDTVRREILEEYGAQIVAIEYVGTHNLVRLHEDRQTHWIVNLHFVEVVPETVGIGEPDKVDEIGWFELSALPEPLHSAVPLAIEMVSRHLERTR